MCLKQRQNWLPDYVVEISRKGYMERFYICPLNVVFIPKKFSSEIPVSFATFSNRSVIAPRRTISAISSFQETFVCAVNIYVSRRSRALSSISYLCRVFGLIHSSSFLSRSSAIFLMIAKWRPHESRNCWFFTCRPWWLFSLMRADVFSLWLHLVVT